MNELFAYIKTFDFRNLLISPSKNRYIQLFRYIFVGGIATIFDWAALYICTESGINYLVSTVIGFILGIIVNYILSKLFVFNGQKSKTKTKLVEIILYSVIGLIGLGMSECIMYVAVDKLGIWYMLGKFVATVITLLWNYIARSKIYK